MKMITQPTAPKFLFVVLIILAPYFTYSQTFTCNNWLLTPSSPSFVNLGDLDVAGNQLTVEAVFNRTTPYSGGALFAGNLVSKHHDVANVNYLLRPNSAEITTSNGYFRAESACEIELNKTYHVAMTYDGITLKFYRNGFLMGQTPASGTLFQNNYQARIGWLDHVPAIPAENFIGYMNEVRIWNVVRTQGQIRMNMSDLPTPTTQPGLLAYYKFNSLSNLQGNPTWNGSLSGSASINVANSSCSYVRDSCGITPLECLETCYWNLSGNNITGNNNLLGTLNASDIRFISNSASRGIVTADGNLGWNTMAPTSRFHVNCTLATGQSNPSNIRFENLQSGRGTALVIDANGYVYRSALPPLELDSETRKEIDLLKREIQELRALINELSPGSTLKSAGVPAVLFQNSPNPFTNNTVISYSLPGHFKKGELLITDPTGKAVARYAITGKGVGQTNVEGGVLKPGVYFYSLYSETTLVDTKRMVVTN